MLNYTKTLEERGLIENTTVLDPRSLYEEWHDLHALLWYVRSYQEMRAAVRSWAADDDLVKLQNNVDAEIYEAAAQLLRIDEQLVRDSIEQLVR